MRWILCLVALVGCAALGAQEFRAAFAHQGAGIVVGLDYDAAGNLYNLTRWGPAGTIYPGLSNNQPIEAEGSWGVMISKHRPDGSLVWAKILAEVIESKALAVSPAGEVFICGSFTGEVDFDPGTGVELRKSHNLDPNTGQHTYDGSNHSPFLLKLNTNGGFEWVRTWGGNYDWTHGERVAVSPNGNIHITGLSFSWWFDMDPGAGNDIAFNNFGSMAMSFLVTVDSDGNYLWGHAFATTNASGGPLPMAVTRDIFVDQAGNVLVCGWHGTGFEHSNFAVVTVAPQVVSPGSSALEGWVVKCDPAGNLAWVHTIGGMDDERMGHAEISGVTAGPDGEVYVTGGCIGLVDFDRPNGELYESHFIDFGDWQLYVGAPFVMRLDADGGFDWVRPFTNYPANNNVLTGSPKGLRVVADESGVCVAGVFGRQRGDLMDADPGKGEQLHNSNNGNGFLIKLDRQGDYKWSLNYGSITYSGGGGTFPQTGVNAMTVSAAGRITIGGFYHNAFYAPAGPGAARGNQLFSSSDSYVMFVDQPDLWQPLVMVSEPSPELMHHAEGQVEFHATGGTGVHYWSLASGTLPEGTSANFGVATSTLAITGAPQALGEYSFSLLVTDDAGNEHIQPFTIHVVPLEPPVEIVTVTLPAGQIGGSYQAVITASGGLGEYDWSVIDGELPPGLNGIPGFGSEIALSGILSARGVFEFTVRAETAPGYSDTRSFTLRVDGVGVSGNAGGAGGGCASRTGSGRAAGALVALLLMGLLMVRGARDVFLLGRPTFCRGA